MVEDENETSAETPNSQSKKLKNGQYSYDFHCVNIDNRVEVKTARPRLLKSGNWSGWQLHFQKIKPWYSDVVGIPRFGEGLFRSASRRTRGAGKFFA